MTTRSQGFRDFVQTVNPRFQWYWHTVVLADVLQCVADGELLRVMVFEPPRHGKSEQISRLFSAYYLRRHPDRTVGLNSYAAELAYSLSRAARDNYTRDGGELRGDSYAVKHWQTTRGGGLWAAGVGGPITGKGFNLGIIDDPLKNAEEAQSETIREKQKDWYLSTFSTRAEPGAAIVIVQTRWHHEDLSGWLLSREDLDEPEQWHIVNLPAIRDDQSSPFPPTCTVEPDPRAMGAALCPERYSLDKLRKTQSRLGSYFWNALYQQRPAPREGDRFKRGWFQVVDHAPAEANRVRYWDCAATAGGGAYSAGVLMAERGGYYYIEDVQRGQWSTYQREQVIIESARRDHEFYGGGIRAYQEQEPGSSGVDTIAHMQSAMRTEGLQLIGDRVTGSKDTRMDPFAAAAEAGSVRVVRGGWNRDYLDELCAIPHGTFRDQADATSGAFNKLSRYKPRKARSHRG